MTNGQHCHGILDGSLNFQNSSMLLLWMGFGFFERFYNWAWHLLKNMDSGNFDLCLQKYFVVWRCPSKFITILMAFCCYLQRLSYRAIAKDISWQSTNYMAEAGTQRWHRHVRQAISMPCIQDKREKGNSQHHRTLD